MSYVAEFDRIDAGQWDRWLLEFDDASIFQSWVYGAARWGENNLSHAVIKKDGVVAGLAQSVLVAAPLFGQFLAYVTFGPVWERRGGHANGEHLQAIIAALREEYVVRRRLCLRLRFWADGLPEDVRAAILADGGWGETRSLYRTYIVDLTRSESELRAAMDRKWRANLRKAEQAGLTVSRRNDQEAVGLFLELHGQMRQRKRFSSLFLTMLPDLCQGLPPELRPELFICWQGQAPVAAAVVSALGNRAFSLNAATGDAALEVRAGYFLQWTIVRWLKETVQCRWYDVVLGDAGPGVRQFKRGLVGAKAPEVAPAELEACGSPLSASITGVAGRLRGLGGRLGRRPRAHLGADGSRRASQPVTRSASSFRISARM
jgi:hypothetical protein